MLLKRFLLIGVAAALLVGCGKEKKKEVIIEPAYQPYYSQIQALASQVGGSLVVEDLAVISVSSLGNPRVLAVCELPSEDRKDDDDARPTVKVGPAWSTLSENSRLALLFHEMLHCVKGSGHNADLFANNNPKDVMNPYLIRTFEGEWQYWYVAKALGADWTRYASPGDSLVPPH